MANTNSKAGTRILDQFGQPIERATLAEPQTSRVASLSNQLLESSLNGLTPARAASILQAADGGDLLAQHRLFADMEDRDAHLYCEIGKRKNALLGLDWNLVPPSNASAAEKASMEWAEAVLRDAVDPLEDLLLALMEAPGHGFAAVELEWRQEGRELLPAFHPRPQEWFRLDPTRRALRLSDASTEGAPLQSFGWVLHTHGKAKSGYLGRMGLYRCLVWPFLYKAYSIGDLAEFLETYGLPIIVGKYFSGASADEKASLLRAVTALGHDARAIMPEEMTLEIQKITGSGDGAPHLSMVDWADRSQSKAILGQVLSAEAKSTGMGSGLAEVHNEVRHDIRDADSRQVAATITRDLIYPLIALNRGGVNGLARCPRFVFDTGESEDLTAYAEALPKLVEAGMRSIPVKWVHEKLRIPEPQDGEAVLGVPAEPSTPPGAKVPPKQPPAALAALSAVPKESIDPLADETEQLASAAAAAWENLIENIKSLVDNATDLSALQAALIEAYGGRPREELVNLMAAAFALAELKGIAAVRGED